MSEFRITVEMICQRCGNVLRRSVGFGYKRPADFCDTIHDKYSISSDKFQLSDQLCDYEKRKVEGKEKPFCNDCLPQVDADLQALARLKMSPGDKS